MIASRLQTLLSGPVDAGPTNPRRTIPLEIVLRSWMFAMGSVGVDPLPPEFAINCSEASTGNRRSANVS